MTDHLRLTLSNASIPQTSVEHTMSHMPQPYRPHQGSTPKQRSNRNARVIAGVLSVGMLLTSLPCVAGALYEMATIGLSADGGMLMVAIFFGGISMVGLMLGLWAVRARPAVDAPTLDASSEHMVLSLAKSNHGKLTVPELSLQARVSLEQSEQLLENMTRRNVAEVDINSDGSIVYVFPAFCAPEQGSHQSRADLHAFSEQLADSQPETQFDFQGASHADGSLGQAKQRRSDHHAHHSAHSTNRHN